MRKLLLALSISVFVLCSSAFSQENSAITLNATIPCVNILDIRYADGTTNADIVFTEPAAAGLGVGAPANPSYTLHLDYSSNCGLHTIDVASSHPDFRLGFEDSPAFVPPSDPNISYGITRGDVNFGIYAPNLSSLNLMEGIENFAIQDRPIIMTILDYESGEQPAALENEQITLTFTLVEQTN